MANPIMQRFWSAAEKSAEVDRQAHRDIVAAAYADLCERNSPRARDNYAKALEALGYYGIGLRVRLEGIEQGLHDPNYWWYAIEALNESGDYRHAKKLATLAWERFPENLEFYLISQLMVPALYTDAAEVESVRSHVVQNLEKIVSDGLLLREENNAAAIRAISSWSNFYLAYQGRDDRAVQEKFASIVTGVMNGAVKIVPRQEARRKDKIRVGFSSEFLRTHVISKTFQGWIKYIDRDVFETRLYHLVREEERGRSYLADYADSYVQAESQVDLITHIYEDDLDILVYLDIGMSPGGLPASLRLAPVQCTTWGHPVTSGMPTIDFFISGEGIEPSDPQRHYSEKLVLLPGPGVTYDPPLSVMPLSSFGREQFGMRDGSTVYLCTQSTFKYLPQYDWVIAEIARRAPDSQFVFIVRNRELAKKFLKRLDREFKARNLSIYDYAIVFPFMDYFLYRHVYALADVFLDTIGFSSFNTALDAISHDVPVVTCRGEVMRGRLASSVNAGVGLDELISDDADSYVDKAVRLAHDEQFRNSMVEKLKANREGFFADRSAIEALEDFFRKAVSETRSRNV